MGVEKIRHAGEKWSVGDAIRVKSGPLEGFSGVIEAVDTEHRKVTARVSMFGRETPVEVDYKDIAAQE